MSLTLSDVKRIANLAQLDMDDAHAEIALNELNGIFALAEQMQAVDTTGVEPLSQPLAAAAAWSARGRSARRVSIPSSRGLPRIPLIKGCINCA